MEVVDLARAALSNHGVALVFCALIACLVQSTASRIVIHVMRVALGPRLYALTIGGPSIVLHEATHILVSFLSGHYIARVHLGKAFSAHGANAHVDVRYNPRSLRQRFGLSVSALSPALLPMLLIAGLLFFVDLLPAAPDVSAWLQQVLAAVGLHAGWVLVPTSVILVNAMALSKQDWRAAIGAIIAAFTVAVAVAWVFPSDQPPLLWPPVLALAGALMLTLSVSLVLIAAAAPAAILRWVISLARPAQTPPKEAEPTP